MPFSGGALTRMVGLSLWNGSSNNAAPAGWYTVDFSDVGWAPIVNAHTSPGEVPVGAPGAVWTSVDPLSATEEAIFRAYVTVPTDIRSVSMAFIVDDDAPEIYVNGVLIAPTLTPEFGSLVWWGSPVALWRPGTSNVIAIHGRNTGGGPAYVGFELSIEDWANAATGDGSSVANLGDYGVHLGPSTTGSGPTVRVRHASGVIDWEHDGNIFRVRSGDLTVAQIPFPTTSATPLALLGKDPTTGLPMWTSADYATKTDAPATTGPLPLPVDPPAPVTVLPSPSAAIHVVPKRKPVPIISPVPTNCPLARCGAAYYLSQKLNEQYDLVRGFLLAMLATPFFFGITPGTILLNALDILIDWLAARVAIDAFVVNVVQQLAQLVAKGFIFINTDFEGLGAGGASALQRLAYKSLWCTGNEFDLTPDMLVQWELAINSDTVDFSEWQRHLLVYCVQFTPFSTYHQLAQHGAAIGSNDCGGW